MKTKTGQIVTGLILNVMGLLYPIIEAQMTDYRKQSFNLVGIMAFNVIWAVVFGALIGAAVKECTLLRLCVAKQKT